MPSLGHIFHDLISPAKDGMEASLGIPLGPVEIRPLDESIPMIVRQDKETLTPFQQVMYNHFPSLGKMALEYRARRAIEKVSRKNNILAFTATTTEDAGIYYSPNIQYSREDIGKGIWVLGHELGHVGLFRYGQYRGYSLRELFEEIPNRHHEGFAEVAAFALTREMGTRQEFHTDYLVNTGEFLEFAKDRIGKESATLPDVADIVLAGITR